jgi:hypothetical protein
MKVIAAATIIALVSTLGFLIALSIQFAFALDFGIQSNGDNSGYIVCDPNCHVSSNSGGNNGGSNITDAQSAYQLTVNIPSHTSDTSTVNISIKTANGYTRQADLSGAGDLSYTFKIPENQGKSAQVCVKSGNPSIKNCRTYEATGSDMSVSLPAISSTAYVRHIGPRWGGYGALPEFYGYP